MAVTREPVMIEALQPRSADTEGACESAGFGLRWVFLMTAAVMAANLVWVYYRVPEYTERPGGLTA